MEIKKILKKEKTVTSMMHANFCTNLFHSIIEIAQIYEYILVF